MTLQNGRSFLMALCFVALIAAGFMAFGAWAIRSDFVQRGCLTIPPEEWVFTANCSDGHFGTWAAGLIAAALLAVSGWSLWRLRHG